jgi:hypothetical protein
MLVRLTQSQFFLAANIGLMRQLKAIEAGSKNRHGLNGDVDGWGLHIEGACGEQAAAQGTGRFWPGSIGTYKDDTDVLGFEVRTRSKPAYDLIIRSDDADERVFVLVTGRAPVFTLCGWIRGADGKCAAYLRSYGNRLPAYFVPQDALQPMETLPPARP